MQSNDGPAHLSGALTEAQAVKRILLATDFSTGAERALAVATDLARAFHATIEILHVYVSNVPAQPVSGVFPAAPSPADLENISRALAELTERVSGAGVECRSAVVEGDPARMIMAHTASVGGDLIVMGTQGRTGLKRLIIGSVAEATLRRASPRSWSCRRTIPADVRVAWTCHHDLAFTR